MATLLAVVVVDLIGFGIVMPVLPFWARTYGADGTTLGLIQAAYAAAQFVFAPIWGRLSDRVGRRPVLLATIAGTACSLLLLGLADSLAGIFLARLLAGSFAANISVAAAYLADVTGEEARTRAMGLLGASFGIGFLVGPALGGLLAPRGYDVPMLFAAGLAATNLGFAVAFLPEPAGRAAREELGRLAVLRDPRVLRVCATYLLFSLAVTQLETVFAYFMLDRFGYDAREVAFILVGMALVMGAIQGGAMGGLARRFRDRELVLGGGALLAAGFALTPLAPSVPLLLVPLLAAAVGRAVAQPALMSLASQVATPATRGAVMGTFQSSASLARVVGPVLAGVLYDRSIGAPFGLAAALLGLALLTARGLSGGAGPDAAGAGA